MLINPRPGRDARVHYRPEVAAYAPHHGRTVRVVIASRGSPRNHGVLIDGRIVVVPCGNLYPYQSTD